MWNLYSDEKFLKPLKFSNGKTQEDIVNEVLSSIKSGEKVIFIRGMCGTGKSAIALNIASKLGKSSIIVPGKALQKQYKNDYERKKYLLKNNGEKMKISIITGRNNHECLFLKNNGEMIPKQKKEVNSRLNDIFSFKKEFIEKRKMRDISADNQDIPCKIEIRERNFFKLREYLKQNKNVDTKNINKFTDVKRIPLASVCPYWSPALPEKYELKNIDYSEKRKYPGLDGETFVIYKRKPGCKFYEQFESYIDSDVIVFNALKYKLESAINRKPVTEVEIIDECDEFLDSFSNQRIINIDRLQNSLINIIGTSKDANDSVNEIYNLIGEIRSSDKISDAINSRKIIPIKETPVFSLLKIFLEKDELKMEIEEESYLFELEETAEMFKDFFDETYLIFNKKDNNLTINVVTTNLAKKFGELVRKNKCVVLMSGTLHSPNVLRNIFGIENFHVIEAETMQQGSIKVVRTGMEMDCKYENLNSFEGRKHFLNALDRCVEIAKKPTLVHVNAFRDLPTEKEIDDFNLKNLISREELINSQSEDRENLAIDDFKSGKKKILFSTKCARGVDFPGEQCNGIVFTKYPYPSPDEPFWKILKETKKDHYWDMYKDKSRRELLQKIYRGLRFLEDRIELLSPDSRVLNFFENGH